MRILDLFSGIGGFALGLQRAGFEIAAFCEIDPFCRKVLRKHWPDVAIYEDIRTLNADTLGLDGHWPIDVICGGFPCQPFSAAGQKRGTEDDRDLWPEMFRLVAQIRPRWVVGENVAGFLDMAFTRTAADLESEGYEVRTVSLPACAIGAPHNRERIWIIAHDRRQRRQGGVPEPLSWQSPFSWLENVRRVEDLRGRSDIPEPLVWRSGHGVSGGVDRLRGLGNAVMPQIAEIIGLLIIQIEHQPFTA